MELRAHCETSAVLKACLVAAQYVGIGSSITTKIDGSLSTTDVVLRTSNGEVRGRTAVLRYIGRLAPDARMEGSTDFETGLVDQWIEFATNEMAYLEGTSPEAIAHAAGVISVLDQHLLAETFLACQRVTMADIAVFCAMEAAGRVAGHASLTPAISRWMNTCRNQSEFLLALEAHNRDSKVTTLDLNASTSRGLPDVNVEADVPKVEPKLMAEFDQGNAALDKIKELRIEAMLYEHVAAFTVEEQGVALGSLAGVKTKNLFFKDKKAGLILVTVRHDRPCDTKTLAKLLGLAGKVKLRFADEETLMAVLGVTQGAVSPLALVNDKESKAMFAVDKALLEATDLLVHPLRNDRSVSIKAVDLVKFVTACGHEHKVLDFSKVKEAPADPESVKNANVKIDPNAAKKAVEKAKEAAKKVKHERSDPSSKAGMKKETLLAMTASKFDDFPEWYKQVITLSEMIDFYDISGCYILRPWAYQIWEAIQKWMDEKIKDLDVQNSYFPLFVSRKALEAEKAHVEGFAAEVAWVCKSGEKDLEEPIAVRPTSETIMYPAFSRWIRSHRDLPLKLNQWSNIVRWEFKNPTPFLRTREFLWQEGHTAHASFEEADEMVMQALDLYRRVYEELLAVPVIMGTKTEAEKFAGGHKTTTVEAYISGTGRAIQGATSHHLGQNFGKMFKIQYEDETGNMAIPWQTSWGLTTRTLGVCIMCHGDDQGLVLPPRVAPLQVVIIPVVVARKASMEDIRCFCDPIVKELKAVGVRIKFDDRDNYTAGWKYNHWEQKGVPVRLEVGPRDLKSKQAVAVRRDTGEKTTLPLGEITAVVQDLLEQVQTNLLARATAERDDHLTQVTEWAEFVPALNRNDIVLTPFCDETEWEEKVKALSRKEALQDGEVEEETTATSVAAKTLCIPLEQPDLPEGTPCFISGKPAKCWVLWGRSY